MPTIVRVTISRYDPGVDEEPYFQTYEVPVVRGMSVMDALDYIYENLDSTVAYFDHAACQQAICRRCTLAIDGRPQLACQTLVEGDVTLKPLSKFPVVRDLVYMEGGD
jgi:succinate dehydrogenase/fumarate reductase iron-sulfur protein